MGRVTGWLITEIERKTDGRLTDVIRQGILDEVEAHLDAAIRARIELGMETNQAEREAVEVFGTPDIFLTGILAVYESDTEKSKPRESLLRGDPTTIKLLWIGSIWPCLWMAWDPWNMRSPILWCVSCLFVYFFARASYKAKRVQFVPIAISTFGIFLCWCLIFFATFTHGNPASIDLLISYIRAHSLEIPVWVAFTGTVNAVFALLGQAPSHPLIKQWHRRNA